VPELLFYFNGINKKEEKDMSWSVSAIGKSDKVAVKLEKELENITYLEAPEAAVKNAVANVIAEALKTQAPSEVKITASGSMSKSGSAPNFSITHSLSLTIETPYGYIE
jgi:hypothetical protein